MPAEPTPDSTTRPATARVFFALWPPAELADHLAAIARAAADRFGGRATRRETIHLTLAFLGDVAESRLDELCAAATAVRAAPFDVRLDRLGFWHHNHLLWGGCDQPPARLDDLQAGLGQALRRAGFKVDGERARFVPHVTLVRKIPLASGLPKLGQLPPLRAMPWPCERFALVRSTPSSAGSAYRVLREFPLVGTGEDQAAFTA